MSNKPIKTFRSQISPRTTLSVWKNDNGLSFTIKRSYKDSSGQWKDTNSFFAADIAALAAMSNDALRFADDFTERSRGQGGEAPTAEENTGAVAQAVQTSLGGTASYDDDDIPF